jgi:uncharacterized protein (DUF697 family)
LNDAVKSIVQRNTVVSAVIGAVLSPIPLIDELVLVPFYLLMAKKIAGQHELGRGQVPWRPIARTTVNGLLARAAANVTVSYIPGVSAAANAASAAALTALLGSYIDDACQDPAGAQPIGVRAIVGVLKDKLSAVVGRRSTSSPSHPA